MSSAIGFYNSGVRKYKSGDYRGAITDYDRAIQLLPCFSEAICARAYWACCEQTNFKQLIKISDLKKQQAVLLSPNFRQFLIFC
jgi:hypothetical protein